jgi:hypothetical protein
LATTAWGPSFTFAVTVVQDTNPTDIHNNSVPLAWQEANSFVVTPSNIHLA